MAEVEFQQEGFWAGVRRWPRSLIIQGSESSRTAHLTQRWFNVSGVQPYIWHRDCFNLNTCRSQPCRQPHLQLKIQGSILQRPSRLNISASFPFFFSLSCSLSSLCVSCLILLSDARYWLYFQMTPVFSFLLTNFLYSWRESLVALALALFGGVAGQSSTSGISTQFNGQLLIAGFI